MPRKLVTVRRVSDVLPIPGADRIEVAVVDGWTCVTPKNDFCKGDLAIFFEIDSFLPASDERWGFLSSNFTTWQGNKGLRVKTMKIRKQVSQGILMPLSTFPEIVAVIEKLEAEHGQETAKTMLMEMSFEDALGVRKYEPPLPANQEIPGQELFLGLLPDFIAKTDQERIQNLPTVFDIWGDKVFQETTKMDGSSMTAYFIRKDSIFYPLLPPLNATGGRTGNQPNGRFGVCSRNRDLVEREGNHFWRIANQHGLAGKLNALNRNIAIQGELCGSSIQRNLEGFPSGFHDFFVFDVWDIDTQKGLPPKETEQWAVDLGLKHVPVHGYATLADMGGSVTDLLARAPGKGINGKAREGIVLKHVDGGFSFKAISNTYLLKHGE
jgi:RNA ligase (TIGR02306 family)